MSRRSSWFRSADATLLLAPLAALLPGCGVAAAPQSEPAAEAISRVLLVTLDTTRADHLGCYGYADAKTPRLDQLAARGVVYERAWTVAPITLSSHTTILTGVYPCAHGVRENGAFEVAPAARLISEALQDAGFRNGAFVGAFVLDPKFGLDQGFEIYRAPDASRLGGKWGVIDRTAAAVADDALAFVDQLAASDRFFLWVHFYDPHHPYQPPGEKPSDEVRAYDGEIAHCDEQLGRILDRLEARGLDDGLLVAVTADHGESLGEHGEKTHGIFVYDATMRVPLILVPPPPGVAPGTRLRTPVSVADLAPTLLQRLAIGREALPESKTPALPSADREDAGERALYLESITPFYSHRQHPIRGVVWKEMKFVHTRRPELYALADDPGELRDLIETRAGLREPFMNRLAALAEEHPPLQWGDEHSRSAEDVTGLRAVGYAAASARGDPFGEEDLPDSKDRIGDLDLVDRIAAAMRDGSMLLELSGKAPPGATPQQRDERHRLGRARLEEGLELLKQLEAGNSKDPMIKVMRSTIQLGLGNYAEAARELEDVVAEDPRHPINHYNLAHAYLKSGRPEWVKRELEKTAHLEPRSLFALRLLVELAIKQKDWPAAAWWLDRLEGCPGQSEADLAEVKRTRGQVQQVLDRAGEQPRPPDPIGEEDLLPEGRRRRAGQAPGAGR